jgi:hypothetical protein
MPRRLATSPALSLRPEFHPGNLVSWSITVLHSVIFKASTRSSKSADTAPPIVRSPMCTQSGALMSRVRSVLGLPCYCENTAKVGAMDGGPCQAY